MTQNNVSNKEEPLVAQETSKKETDYPSNGRNNRKDCERRIVPVEDICELDVEDIGQALLDGELWINEHGVIGRYIVNCWNQTKWIAYGKVKQ